MVLVKKWDFFHVLIVGKIGKEKVTVDILEKKRLSRLYNQGVKKKRRKLAFFSKRVSPWFGRKNDIFPRFYLWQNRHWNKKTPFYAITTKSSNSRKIDIS